MPEGTKTTEAAEASEAVETVVDDASEKSSTGGSGSHVESEEAGDGFRAITTQDDFDAAIKQRIARAEKGAEKKFSAQISELESIVHAFENEKLSEDEKKEKRLEELTASLAERDKTIKGFERDKLVTNLAAEHELPRKFWDRVRGDTEDDIAADIADLLDALPKAAAKTSPSSNGTVKVQSTGDDGEQPVSADAILSAIDPTYRKT
jgi:ribosome-binding protein aMBF1 (putative translation factor)